MQHTIDISSLEEIGHAAEEFLNMTRGHKLIAFQAPMGAGKTTFTTAIAKALGVTDPVCSPTFTIVNEYLCSNGEPIYHFDFYRLKTEAEAMDIGLYDYLDSGSLCIMEWPENIDGLLPEDTLMVRIGVNSDGSRTVSWED